MSIRCKNGSEHTHETVAQSRLCWHRVYNPEPTRPFVASPPPPAPAPAPPSSLMVSERQLQYVEQYHGDLTYARKLTYIEAYKYVAQLMEESRIRTRPLGASMQNNPKLKMLKGMIDLIPDGYYATAAEGEGGHVDFIRLSRPIKGQYKGAVKIQTQHSEKWDEALILWPSGNWSVYKWPAVDIMLLVLSDHRGCARRYGIEVQACQRCNKTLTDDRSRHYLIGPECESKHNMGWVIEEVDDINNGFSYEDLVRRGMPTRVWQESVSAA